MDYTVYGIAKSWTQLSDFHLLTHSISHTKIKWVKDIYRPETIELPEENMGRALFDIKSSSVPGQQP